MNHCTTRQNFMKYGRICAWLGPTVQLGIHFVCGEEAWQGGVPLYHGGEPERRQVQMCHVGKNCEVGKKLGRCGSHFATRDEFTCSEVACQDWVPLYHKGETGEEETGPIVPVGKNSWSREELGQRWVSLCHQGRTREETGPTVPLGKN